MTRHLGVMAVVLAALVGGWLFGASGKGELVRALRTAEVQNDLLEARASLLGARVNLCDADFHGMSRHLETARAFVARAGERLQTPDQAAERRRLDVAGMSADIDEARRLAATLTRGTGGMAPLQ